MFKEVCVSKYRSDFVHPPTHVFLLTKLPWYFYTFSVYLLHYISLIYIYIVHILIP